MAFHASKFLRKLDHLIEEVNRKDIVVIKIDVIFFTLLVVHFWPELAQAHRGWYVVAVMCCEAYLFIKLRDRTKPTSPKKKKTTNKE